MKYVRFLLFPFAILYDLVTSIRNFLFQKGIFESTSFSIPVFVVGNISVGGTGKTPQIEYLIRLLKDNYRVAVLSRGYKRKTKGFLLLNEEHKVDEVGDEPLQYYNKFNNINVAVDANRVEGIRSLIEKKSPDIILLDDAFQHRKIKGSFYILLTKYDDLFTNDFLLPTGNLRESRVGAHRTNVIVVTKCPAKLSETVKERIKQKFNKYKKEVFFSTISYADKISGFNDYPINELKGFEVLLITGIANPSPLLSFLEDKSIKFTHLEYSDHHNFSLGEIEAIKRKFNDIESNKKIILTTEKDYTRLRFSLNEISFLEMKTTFLDNKNTMFNKIIESHIQQNRC